MVMQSQANDAEPTPEFNERCLTLVDRWQQGDMTTEAITAQMKMLVSDAVLSGHVANQGRAEHIQGYIHFYLGNLSVSIMHYDRARSLFQRVNNKQRVATVNLNQGEIYRYRGEFKRARRLYRSAYQAASELGDMRLQTIAITNEGLTLISLKDYEKAKRALEDGYRLSERWDADTRGLYGLRCEIHQGLAQIALETDKPANAWDYASLALENAQHAGDKLSVGLAYRSLGDALTHLEETPANAPFDDIDAYYRAALTAFEKVDAQAEIGKTMYSKAESFAHRGRQRAAAKLFRDALVIFTRLGMTADAARAAEAQLRVM